MARKLKFKTGEYYHIYNRGVDKRQIFTNDDDYIRFINSVNRFNRDLVLFISYNLIDNHFHFELKQLVDNGISKFMHKLGTGYTLYFNNKYSRSGSLFENVFKAIHIDSEDYLIWLSGYIHNNSEKHRIAKNEDWIWSTPLLVLIIYSAFLPPTSNGVKLFSIFTQSPWRTYSKGQQKYCSIKL